MDIGVSVDVECQWVDIVLVGWCQSVGDSGW